MAKIFGDFIENLPSDRDSLEIVFTPSSRPLKQRWRNNRLSANFVADYFSTFLPFCSDDLSSKERIKESKSAVSYMANELLENAIKFNDKMMNYCVKFGVHFIENTEIKVVIFATNSITAPMADKFQRFIKELIISDLDDLYVRQIENSAEDDNIDASGLGFITAIDNYSAKLGWKFDELQDNPKIITVTTMAQITI